MGGPWPKELTERRARRGPAGEGSGDPRAALPQCPPAKRGERRGQPSPTNISRQGAFPTLLHATGLKTPHLPALRSPTPPSKGYSTNPCRLPVYKPAQCLRLLLTTSTGFTSGTKEGTLDFPSLSLCHPQSENKCLFWRNSSPALCWGAQEKRCCAGREDSCSDVL